MQWKNHSKRPYLKGVTVQKAKELLKSDLKITESSIKGSITVSLKQNQYDALVSFVFNVGPSAFKYSTLKILINSKQFTKAGKEFLKWNKMTIDGKKQIVNGLTNRRIAEKVLFEQAVQ